MSRMIPDRQSSRYSGQYAGASDPSGLTQIFTDSVRIALSSKDRDTATARFELAVEVFHQVMSMHLADNLRTSMRTAMTNLAEQFPVQVVLNEALGLREKAAKLKTAKKKIELLQRARDSLQRGLAENPGSAAMQDALAEIREETAALRP